jgi:hypothetical protein
MFSRTRINFSRLAVAIAAAGIMTACGGSGAQGPPAPTTPNSVPAPPMAAVPPAPAFAVPPAPGSASRSVRAASQHAAFFGGEIALTNGVYYLQFANSNYFGYYSYLQDYHYVYHFDMGYEYVFDSTDPNTVYFYDFASQHFFYTGANLFPYLYDFTLKSYLYYYPSTQQQGHYTSSPRFFFNFNTGTIITQ